MTIDASAVARVLGIDTRFEDARAGGILFLPQRIAVFAQGSSAVTYPSDKFQPTSAGQVGALMGFGSPAHLIARELFPTNGDGVQSLPVTFFPLVDDVSGVASAGDITPSGSQTKAASYRVRIAGILSEPFVISVGDTVAEIVTAMTLAINAVLEMPVIASDDTTEVGLASKWEGVTANDLPIEVIGEALGTAFAITQMAGGLVDPTTELNTKLLELGNVWYTMLINALRHDNTTNLDNIQAFGEGRWGQLVRKPFVSFYGNPDPTPATVITVTNPRKEDRVNCQLTAPGSVNFPAVVAARQVARIAVLANNNPPHDYGRQRATGLVAGTDAEQWNHAQRQLIVLGGSSTSEAVDGIVRVSDVVTPWKPDEEPIPAYRFVVDIVKVMQIIFNIDLTFNNEEWDGAPMIPDIQPTVNPKAKKPKMAKAAVNAVIDSLGLNAIVSDPETGKKNTRANISATNPKRLDIKVKVQIAGNTNIIDVDLAFSFFFGTAEVVG